MSSSIKPLLVILGPTASGKTELAARVAYHLNGEIISADSRQVYRGMDIGTGKDYEAYVVEGRPIPYHLIDQVDPGYEYSIFDYQRDFAEACQAVLEKGHLPVLCGGSGLYMEAVLKKYALPAIPADEVLDRELREKSEDELKGILLSLRIPHNTTDLLDRDRLMRAIQIGLASRDPAAARIEIPEFSYRIVGIRFDRLILNNRISERLTRRLKSGMIEEVEWLLGKGYTIEQMKFFGLEYRYIAMYLNKELLFDEMVRTLESSIRQFAKRQMTWFRRMERAGFMIHWLDGMLPVEENTSWIINVFQHEK
jgi:tRNA dimethylallyltransferase